MADGQMRPPEADLVTGVTGGLSAEEAFHSFPASEKPGTEASMRISER